MKSGTKVALVDRSVQCQKLQKSNQDASAEFRVSNAQEPKA